MKHNYIGFFEMLHRYTSTDYRMKTQVCRTCVNYRLLSSFSYCIKNGTIVSNYKSNSDYWLFRNSNTGTNRCTYYVNLDLPILFYSGKYKEFINTGSII